ncbi:MAG: coenzyme F420-0:L-glutamate ligase [Candidatus Hodarchaeota archaeon]
MKYTLLAIPTRLIKPQDDIIDVLIVSLAKQNITMENGDILVIASKVISTVENRLHKLIDINVSQKAVWYAERTELPPEFVELVLTEAEKIYGWVHGALLTLRNGILQANAGVDASNAPPGFAVLLPADPNATADYIRKEIMKRTGVKVGIIISDSHTRPLRMGTTSFALAASGLQDVVVDERGKHDLFGRAMRVTRRAVADSLATAALLLMGETAERVPIVIIRNAPISISERTAAACESDMKIDQKQCMFLGTLKK